MKEDELIFPQTVKFFSGKAFELATLNFFTIQIRGISVICGKQLLATI
ncbi:hypothetical protein [Pedobacter sp. AJM]|nr:hypothetical protein [Pedobacter sp. AJM]